LKKKKPASTLIVCNVHRSPLFGLFSQSEVNRRKPVTIEEVMEILESLD
jgi:hypothetical protein